MLAADAGRPHEEHGELADLIDALALGALGLSLTDAAIVCAAAGYLVKVLADQRGWTRSTALVRQENADLRERNATLAADNERLDQADREKGEENAVLRDQNEMLKKQDQKAVLDAVAALAMQAAAISTNQLEHEQHATTRRAEQKAEHVASMTAAADHHSEAMAVFREILAAVATRYQQEEGGGT